MSRNKSSRLPTDVCGDCGASDPSWASINRGILLCTDCCSVHRSLGRHISIVKSLRQGNWEPSVLNFVNSLNAHSANSVWEHQLIDVSSNSSSGKGATRWRKPTPKDALHPTKSDFIRAKHVNLAFVLKPSLQDDEDIGGGNVELELNKQLHASVRTSNLETSLRFLVQGADPNFFHDEKLSTPLHVAAKFGQASQIEMLLVYGADVNTLDGNGMTPLDVAKANNHNTIADRLLDAMYDVTDRIIMFLGGKKPDHACGQHLVVHEGNSNDISEQLKVARGRLQLVPNKMFEELVMDLYDEVDRRECEAIWTTSAVNAEHATVPFLPANPFLSATRNQGRQKLARFSREEFAGLLTDVLIDARRRQNMANLRPLDGPPPPHHSMTASVNHISGAPYGTYEQERDPSFSDEEPIYDPVASDDDYAPVQPIAQQAIVHQQPGEAPRTEMESLRKQLSVYQSEINQLRTVVQKLSSENSELKSKFTTGTSNNSIYDEPLRIDLGNSADAAEREPHSLPERISGGAGGENASTTSSEQSTIKRPASMYERRAVPSFAKLGVESRTTTSLYQMPADMKTFSEDVKARAELVTRRLKELILAMQPVTEEQKRAIVPCAERMRYAVADYTALFMVAHLNTNEITRENLKQLTRYNILIQRASEDLENGYEADDKASIERYTNEVRDCAYHIASATKTLVMQFY